MSTRLAFDKFTGFAFLIFFIPLSFPLMLGGGFTLMFPSEILITILALVAGMRYFLFDPLDKKILLHPVSILILLDVGWQLISSLYSEAPGVAFKRTIVTIIYLFIYYLVAAHLFAQPKNILRANRLYILGLIIPIIYTLYKHSWFNFTVTSSPHISRPFYNDHTIYGATLAFFIPFVIFFLFKKHKHKRNLILNIFLFILFGLAIFLSYSRAAWLSLAAMAVFFVVIQMKYKRIVVGTVLILSFLSIVLWGDHIYELIQSRANSTSKREDLTEHIQSVTNLNTDVSNAERINRWKSALKMFYEKPITGFGPGTYQFYYGNFQEKKDMTRISTYSGDKGHAHSEYLNRLSETGWPGLLLFVSIISLTFYTAWKAEKEIEDIEMKNLLRTCTIALLGFFVHGIFNGFMEMDKIAMPVYSSIAAIVALDLKAKTLSANKDILI